MKGLTNPLVSIIILTYNRAKLLIEALESVLAQTYRNIEIIVVNDASPDNTEEVLLPYMKHIRYIKNEKNLGCAGSKNVGLEAARGELITNLDDDDCIKPEKIARQVEMFQERPQMGVCATGTIHIDKDGQHIRTYMPPRFSRRNQTLLFLRK
ncbi:MAG: glycosyltransferase family 2 protein, partial [Verrucomicrobia bacterium]|nr:glycosyltransferase family 2 protein [Verrucomicrobiota bacterium]